MSMVDATETERRIAEKVDPSATGAVALSHPAGGIAFSNMAEAMHFAKLMAISQFAVPKHLRGNVGACMAITIQAVEWHMSPFSVANKSYLVNDRLAYESQLVQAVVLQRAPIVGRFNAVFNGDGERRQCTVSATLREGGERVYTSPELGKIAVKNSLLWKNDPDQQLFYYSARAMCRRFFPDVLLGIYTPEELYDAMERRGPDNARDVTPRASDDLPERVQKASREQIQAVVEDAERADREHQAALADPTGEKAGELLAQQLGERGLKLMGLI